MRKRGKPPRGEKKGKERLTVHVHPLFLLFGAFFFLRGELFLFLVCFLALFQHIVINVQENALGNTVQFFIYRIATNFVVTVYLLATNQSIVRTHAHDGIGI